MARAKYTKTTKTRVRKGGKNVRRCNVCGGKGYYRVKK